MKSDFKILPDEEGDAVVYQGYCTWGDIGKVPAFVAMKKENNFFTDETSLDILKQYLPTYDIIVFMGTWCSDSQELLPPFYEIMQKAQFPEHKLTLIAVDREKKAADGIEKQYAITNVPTFILVRDGTERGRITEQVKTDMLQDLINLVKADQQK